MTLPRRLASSLLAVAARLGPADARAWADAMRAELTAIEGEWAALRWSIGGALSLIGYFGLRALVAHLRPPPEAQRPPERPRAAGVVAMEMMSGAVVAAGIVAAVVVADLLVLRISWHQFAHAPIAERLLLVGAIEAAFVSGALALPRRRRPLAAGMLLCGMMLFVHVAAHG